MKVIHWVYYWKYEFSVMEIPNTKNARRRNEVKYIVIGQY